MLGVAKAIAAAANLPAVLQLIVENTVNFTGAKACSISLLEPSGRRLEPSAVYGLPSAFLETGPVELDKAPISSEVLRGKNVVIPDVFADPRITNPSEFEELGISSMISVEIAAGERPLGVMNIYRTAKGEPPADQMDLLLTMANLGAVGIESAKSNERLYRRCADLGVLNQVAEDINVSLKTDEVVTAIVTEVPKILNAKACALRLFDQTSRRVTPIAQHGLSKRMVDVGPINLENSPLDEEALKGTVVTVPDIETDRRWRYPEIASAEGIYSAAVAPMVIKGKPVGTQWLYFKEPRIFGEEEKALFIAIARHSAIAIENARLYELTVKTHEQLVQDVWAGLPDVWGTIAGERRAA